MFWEFLHELSHTILHTVNLKRVDARFLVRLVHCGCGCLEDVLQRFLV